jgi:hypothetical protein
VHRSNDVWRLAFDSGDTLGVTYNHPIYSATAGDWRLAGELEIGEEVLTYNGAATLCSKAPLPGAHVVYNLEVKDWHNFLVGELGVVVHNSCITWVTKQAIQEAIQFQNLRNALINNLVYIPDNWIRNTNIQNGIKYVDPTNSGKYIRMQKEGGATAVGKPWHGKPYYRVVDGTYPPFWLCFTCDELERIKALRRRVLAHFNTPEQVKVLEQHGFKIFDGHVE